MSIRLTLSEIAARSQLVIQGRVERIESSWTASGEIESTVYVRLTDVVRGALSKGALIPLHLRGGTVGGLTMVSSEEPVFREGEETLVFLAGLRGRSYQITEGQQGKFDVAGGRAINRSWGAQYDLSALRDGVRTGSLPDALPGAPEPAAAANSASGGIAPDDYVLYGQRWPGPNAMQETFVVNLNTGDIGPANGSAEDFRSALIASATMWNNAGAAFSFKYGGVSSVAVSDADSVNVIYWENMGGSSILAEATWWTYDHVNIIDADIRFNDYYMWDATGAPAGNEPDVQSVATHELGHWLALGHDDDPDCPDGPIMCPSYRMGTVDRDLWGSDIAGIRAIYGGGNPPTATLTPTRTATPTRTRTPLPTLRPDQIKGREYLPMLLK